MIRLMKPNTIQVYPHKRTAISDPIYGFITVPSEFIFYLIEHPYLQRLRRIGQLGTSYLVYPGALHTRFHHVLGAMHLMTTAIEVIRQKGHVVTMEEEQAVLVAILLHDIGHGPFSHTLEQKLLHEVHHERVSDFFMQQIEGQLHNRTWKEYMQLARQIFANRYHKAFLCQLVSSQLDLDRLDYLNRDSFYTGVNEGIIGSSRIIEMLNVHDNQLVLEEKGIYSIERFITARRLMYWQVYLHKTVVSADLLLSSIVDRARYLLHDSPQKTQLFGTESLLFFLKNKITTQDLKANPQLIDRFAQLDDHDVMSAIKEWQFCEDKILSNLSQCLINRRLFKIEINRTAFATQVIEEKKIEISRQLNIPYHDAHFFVHATHLVNNAYSTEEQKILILLKNGTISQLFEVSEHFNTPILTQPVERYCLCYPKTIETKD